jgi:hypothetical protein
MNTSS